METYRCPVCNKPLSKKEYEKALKIDKAKEVHLHHLEQQLKKSQRELPKKIEQARREAQLKEKQKAEHSLSTYRNQLKKRDEILKKMKRETSAKVESAKKEGDRAGIRKNSQMLLGLKTENQKLKERIDQLRKGMTPQGEGLEDEGKLAARLRREFPDDEVQHKGKGGDVLQIVMFKAKQAGLIIYECKRTPTIQGQHVRQTFLAKQSRSADFGVLVTTGKRRDFSGFKLVGGVYIVDPLGVLSLAILLRGMLIEMLRAKITKEERARLAQKLMKYIDSPQFKNPIEEVIHLSIELREMVNSEYKDHCRIWIKRLENYQKINFDNSLVRDNLQLVLHGKEPKSILHAKISPLQLPAALTPDKKG